LHDCLVADSFFRDERDEAAAVAYADDDFYITGKLSAILPLLAHGQNL